MRKNDMKMVNLPSGLRGEVDTVHVVNVSYNQHINTFFVTRLYKNWVSKDNACHVFLVDCDCNYSSHEGNLVPNLFPAS